MKMNVILTTALHSLGIMGLIASLSSAADTLVIQGDTIHTGNGTTLTHGAIVCKDGKILAIGDANTISIPSNAIVKQAKVVVPGLIDVRTCVGLSGIYNVDHDSDHLESSSPLQPELRAIDAYNPKEELVEYIRSFGVTTVHTGHAPGELITGQTLIAKTYGNSVEEAMLVDGRAICATLAEVSKKSGKQSPGTRGKQMAMLRTLMLEALEYKKKVDTSPQSEAGSVKSTPRNLKLESLVEVLDGKKALLITADRSQDIATALRFADEFEIKIWLDSAAEAHLMIPQIQKSNVSVLLHPTMARSSGEKESLSFENAIHLHKHNIPFAIQGGFEPYVPKVRVVLFEAAVAAAHGLPRDKALESITLAPAKILGIDHRVGSIEIGKDADLAMFDGDPFEYTSHCIATVIDGKLFDGEKSN